MLQVYPFMVNGSANALQQRRAIQLLFVKYVESTPYWSDNGEPEHFETITVMLPEYVVRQVSHYDSKLDAELAKPGYNENVLITIEDDYMHAKHVYNHAIQFLASGFLSKLGGDESTCKETLESLTFVYDFSVLMHAKTLELAVIKHVDDFKGLTLPVFLDFAHSYYANDENNHDGENDSLALLIKKMLAKFMPQIIERKMVQEIQKDGKIGQQFVDVLAEFYTGHKVAVKRKVVEISDDEEEPVKQELHED
jgi:hypothetical protein